MYAVHCFAGSINRRSTLFEVSASVLWRFIKMKTEEKTKCDTWRMKFQKKRNNKRNNHIVIKFRFDLDIMYSLTKCTPSEYLICVWLMAKYRPHGVNGKSYALTQRSMHFCCPKCRMSQPIAFMSIWRGKTVQRELSNFVTFFAGVCEREAHTRGLLVWIKLINQKIWIADIWSWAMIWKSIGAFTCWRGQPSRYQHVPGKSFE